MRAVCYARVSSAAQRERDTIASQLRVLPEFIARMGWVLVKPVATYVDDGHSASSGKLAARTGLSALLRDAALRQFDVVAVVDMDRLTRSEDLTERFAILGALQRAGVQVASSMGGEVMDLSTSHGDLMVSLKSYFAAEDNRKRRERVLSGKVTSISRGRKPAGRTPYGLMYDREKKTFSLDPVRAPIVVEIHQRIAAGQSCETIAKDFAARDVPAYLMADGRVGDGLWTRERVFAIVRLNYSCGRWIVNKRDGVSIAVPRIIEDDLLRHVLEVMPKTKRTGWKKTKGLYLIESLATCGQCGSPMRIRWVKRAGRKLEPNYICGDRRACRRGEPRCMAPLVPTREADARIWEQMCIKIRDPRLPMMIAEIRSARAAESNDWEADERGYRAHLARIDRLGAQAMARHGRGAISEAMLEAELARIMRERTAIEQQLKTAVHAQASVRDVDVRMRGAELVVARYRAQLATATLEIRRDLAALLIEPGSAVFDGPTVNFGMRFPRMPAAASGESGASGGCPDDETSQDVTARGPLRIRVVA